MTRKQSVYSRLISVVVAIVMLITTVPANLYALAPQSAFSSDDESVGARSDNGTRTTSVDEKNTSDELIGVAKRDRRYMSGGKEAKKWRKEKEQLVKGIRKLPLVEKFKKLLRRKESDISHVQMVDRCSNELTREVEEYFKEDLIPILERAGDQTFRKKSADAIGCITHAIDNATDSHGSSVEVEVIVNEQTMELKVIDHGSGLPFKGKTFYGGEAVAFMRNHGIDKRVSMGSYAGGGGRGTAFMLQSLSSAGGELKMEETPGGGVTLIFTMPLHISLVGKDLSLIVEADPLKRVEQELRRWVRANHDTTRRDGGLQLWDLLEKNGLSPDKYYTELYIKLIVRDWRFPGARFNWADLERAMEKVKYGWGLRLAASQFKGIDPSDIELAMCPPGRKSTEDKKSRGKGSPARLLAVWTKNKAMRNKSFTTEDLVKIRGFSASTTHLELSDLMVLGLVEEDTSRA